MQSVYPGQIGACVPPVAMYLGGGAGRARVGLGSCGLPLCADLFQSQAHSVSRPVPPRPNIALNLPFLGYLPSFFSKPIGSKAKHLSKLCSRPGFDVNRVRRARGARPAPRHFLFSSTYPFDGLRNRVSPLSPGRPPSELTPFFLHGLISLAWISPTVYPGQLPERSFHGRLFPAPSLHQLLAGGDPPITSNENNTIPDPALQAIPALSTRLPVFRPGVSALLLVDGQFGRHSFVRLPPAAVQPPREPAESRCRCGPEGVGKISDGSKTAR